MRSVRDISEATSRISLTELLLSSGRVQLPPGPSWEALGGSARRSALSWSPRQRAEAASALATGLVPGRGAGDLVLALSS